MDFVIGILNALIVLSSLFLICMILIQRGKGGGLAGAFGGVGGSSAFGTKAGDIFTRITMVVAIGLDRLTAMLLVVLTNRRAAGQLGLGETTPTSVTKDARRRRQVEVQVPGDGPSARTAARSLRPRRRRPTPARCPPPPPPVDIPAIPDQPAKTPRRHPRPRRRHRRLRPRLRRPTPSKSAPSPK